MSVIRHMRPVRPLVSIPTPIPPAALRFASSAPSSAPSTSTPERSESQSQIRQKKRRDELAQAVAQAPAATIERPFERLYNLPRGLPGTEYLNAVHLSAFGRKDVEQGWFKAADIILGAPCDDIVLERILRVLSQLETGTASRTVQVLKATLKLMQAAARSGSLVFVEAAVSQGLRLLELLAAQDLVTEGRSTKDVGNRLIHQHYRLIRAMVGNEIGLWSVKNASQLPSTVQRSIVRVVRHLLDVLESLPSTSRDRATLALRPTAIDWLLAPPYCVPESMALILNHLQANDIELTEKQCANASASCFAAGDALSGLKWLAKSGSEPTEWERLGLALQAKTFRAAAGILEPLMKNVVPKPPKDHVDPVEAPNDGVEREGTEADAENLQRHAWSVLATIASLDKTMSTAELLQFASHVPEHAYCAPVATPIIVGLMRHRAWTEAGDQWQTLLDRHRDAAPTERHRYLDAAALTVGAQLKYLRLAAAKAAAGVAHYDATPEAVRLVDWYAARPPLARPLGEHVRESQTLDTGALNSLLSMCRQAGAAGLAFRLWRAARPRWGVRPDDTSLGLLLDTARLSFFRLEAGDSVAVRLRLIADALGSKRRKENPQDREDAYWRSCGADALVNGYAYSWRAEYGALQPWELARDVFEAVVLGNWPALADVKTPLSGGSLSVGGLRGLWSTPEPAHAAPKLGSAEHLAALASRTTLLPASSPYAHLIPSARTFQAYAALLARTRADPAAMPRALAWMRELGIQPLHKTLITALLFVNEHEGPRRLVTQGGRPKLMRDEEILAAWLREWCEDVPDENEVAHYRREREVRIEHARALARELEQ